MAIIGTIRKRSGFLVIIIGVALASFVLGDFLKAKPKNVHDVGEIADEKISYREFEMKADEYIGLVQEQNKGKTLSAEDLYDLKQETWKNLVKETLLNKELEALGITVTTDELFDLVQGKNPHRLILQSFSDPKTGTFNPEVVSNFLQTLDQREPDVKKQWLRLEKAIKDDRINTKYLNLIKSAYYVPTAFAKRDYIDKNKSADFNYVLLNYKSIPDASISVSKEDLEKAYKEHKHEFNVEKAFCNLEYVIFEIQPSKEDREKLEKDINNFAKEFPTTNDVAYFVNTNSDVRYDSTFKKQDQLPVIIDSLIFNSPVGKTVGPLNDNNTYYMARLMDVQYRPDSVKASHILIRFAGTNGAPKTLTRTKEEAKAKADSIVNVLKKQPEKFAELATKLSEDESVKDKQGDLGWFADGLMVPQFNEACFKGKKGDKVVVETPFGYHVISITDQLASVKKVKVAIINRALLPSNDTYQKVYAEATKFVSDNKTVAQFDKALADAGKSKRVAEDLKVMDNSIPGLKSPREIIRWAFDEKTEKDQISKVFDADGKYVIAILKQRQEKGIPTLESIKDKIQPIAIKDKKAEMLVTKMNTAKSSAVNIDQLSQKLGVHAEKCEAIKFSSYNLPAIGPEPEVIGTAFALKKGVLSKPIIGGNGVFVIAVSDFYEAPAIEDYTASKKMLQNFFMQRASYEINNTLEKVYEITDNRQLFY